MKFLIVAVMISVALGGSVLARFDEGLAAAKRGDYAAAHRELRPLAEAGDPQAQHNLGVMYYNGRGVEQNFTEAANWFRRAAEQGVAEAQSSLGYMYQKGEGVTQDYAQSTLWYRQAAEQGFGWAQYSLGAAYAAGEGVRQDMVESARWYRQAAAQGLEVPAWTTVPSVFTQAPAAGPARPARLYDPPAPARMVAPSPPPIEPPSPTIGSRPKAASAWRIQIAAVASTEAAKKEWQRIASANEDLLSKLKLDIRRADLGARGVFYRVQAGPLTSKSEARDLCTALKERKERCFIVPAK